MVEEGSEVLGHDRLLQRLLIVGDQEGGSEEEWDNRIEEEQSKWVDKQFPPDKSAKRSFTSKVILVSEKIYICKCR